MATNSSFMNRVIGVMRLDVNAFEEIEHDESATVQAAIVVGGVALLTSIGAAISARNAPAVAAQLEDTLEGLGADLGGLGELVMSSADVSVGGAFISTFIGAFLTWLIWSAVTFFIGTKLFGGKADLGEMLRVVGFAQAPGAIGILSVVPGVSFLLCLLSPIILVWSLACSFIGVRQGLDLDNMKTFWTVLLGIIPAAILSGIGETLLRSFI